ncbi:MAG: PhzF family phenazine biosynthesis protein, partial [Ignavibacteriales bacterium]|nr:PhzF family phenazine biosynthesis protein [Ignavibacteriales bacterium]
MKRISIRHVNAFTTAAYSGNPAGVVPDARGLSEETMQLIARELAMSETAFVLPSTIKIAGLQIRWFTPATEVPLCGHATIAAFHTLAEEGMYGMRQNGTYRFAVQTKSGVLRVIVEKRTRGTTIEFQLPVPAFSVSRKTPRALLQA